MEENNVVAKSDREREKCGLYRKSQSTQVFDGGQMFQRFQDNREQTEPINTTTSSSLSPFSLTSTDEQIDFCQQDENDVLMAEGVAAQRKRLNSNSQSKIQLKKYNEFLINKIKELEDRIASRDMTVNALQRELDYFRDISVVDASAGPLTSTSFSHDSGDSSRLQMMSPLSKNEELLFIKLKQRETEVLLLKEELKTRATSAESEQMSNKIVVLESQIKEQAETIDQLNLEVVQKTKMLDRVQDQLHKKSEDFGKHNMKTTLEIKRLKKNVEELARELRNKDNELKQARDELSLVRHDLECNFGCQLASLKEQLKLCHDEERGRLNVIYDDLQVKYNRAHETEVACYQKQIEALSNRVKEQCQSEQELETELEACRLAHDAQINSYKECVGNLMEELAAEKEKHEIEFKRQIEKYKTELERYKYELDSCMQQLKNADNRMDEEKKKIEEEYAEKIMEIHSKYEAQFVIYKCCTESLRKKEQIATEEAALLETQYQENICELKKEIEKSKEAINDTNLKLLRSENNEKDLIKKLEDCKMELNKSAESCLSLKEKLQAKESREEELLLEFKKSQGLIDEFKIQVEEYEKLRDDIASVEVKHENEIITFQNQIDHLMSTIAEIKSKHKDEVNQLVEQVVIQQQQIESLQDLAGCDNLDAVYDKLKDYEVCNEEIKSLREKLNVASKSVCEYENRLSELHKCYDSEISLYKNQIEKLQEELNSASCLEENLIRQLNNQMTGMKESKERIRDLLLKKDIQVYFVEKDASCNNCSDDVSSSSKEICDIKFQNDSENSASQGEISEEIKLLCNQLDQLTAENQTLKQELDDLKKSHCNLNKLQLKSSEQQRKHIEHALLKELEKELHDCKLDNTSKTHDIEELVCANNDLADHYNNAEIQLNNLKEFTAQKVAEIDSLRNENERLIEERTLLESNQIILLAKLESLSQNSQEMASLPSEIFLNQGYHLDLRLKKFFKNVATSTPDLADSKIYDDIEDGLTPKRKFTDFKCRTNQMLSRWMNNCNELEVENTKLKKEIELLKLQLKEMECCSDAIKSQMGTFEENCESLKTRIIELESKKKVIRELELMNEQLKLRNEKLEEDRLILRSDIANLKEENINIEKKYDKTLAQLLAQSTNENFDGNEAFESLVFELNKKSEEVLLLKEELSLKQETITSLEDELHKLLEIRKEMTLRLDNLLQDLKGAEEELLNLRQERLNIGLEKRLSEKKLLVLKAHNEQLLKYFSNKVQKNCNNEVISIVEELEKELVELHKNLSAERGVIERMSVERSSSKTSGNSSDGSETSFKVELLLNTFEQLQNEKETLKSKTVELQEIIDKYVDCNEVDEDWKLEVKESQKRLLVELEGYGKQHFDLGKTLIETEELKAKAELAEKELMMKIEEKLKVENLLAEERQGLKNALNRINYLESQLCEKMNVLQALNEEKEDLQGNLMALQEKLCSLEEHLEQQKMILAGEIQERELRVRHAHLELHAAQVDKDVILNKMILDAKAESEMEKVSHLREELEKEHDMAICRLKRLYTSQLHEVLEGAAVQQQALEQNHQEQVMMPHVLATNVNDDSSNMEYE